MNPDESTLSFDAPDMAERLAAMTDAEIDVLPFGVLLISAEGKVLKYSRREAEQSGFGVHRTPVGRAFFTQLAPCMDEPALRARIAKSEQAGQVDIEFGHIGDYADRERPLRIRVLSAPNGAYWHLHQRKT